MRWERSCLKAAWEPFSGNLSMMFTFFLSTIVHVKHQIEMGDTHLQQFLLQIVGAQGRRIDVFEFSNLHLNLVEEFLWKLLKN